MSSLNERLLSVEMVALDPRQCCSSAQSVPSLLRAIRVLVEQRDRLIENSLRERVILPDTFDAMFSHRVGASNAAVLAALDAKETT